MRLVTKPVIDSHTCCRALVNLERNCTDDQLRAIAATGGVVGIHFSSRMIGGLPGLSARVRRRMLRLLQKKVAALEQQYTEPYEFIAHRFDPHAWPKALGGAVEDGTRIQRATVEQLVNQIDHMVEVAGVDHVGLGTDYDLGDMCEIDRVDKLPRLTAALARRGYRAADIRKILGENFLRVFRAALPA
jgi:membrane dipeptidase